MNLQQYLAVFRERWKVVALGVLVGLLGALLFAFLRPPSYTAHMTLYVYAQSGAGSDSAYEGTLTSEKRVSSYAALVTDDRVVTDVVDRLRLSETPEKLSKQISASSTSDSVLIDLSVTQRTPTQAAEVANAVAGSFIGVVNDLERPTSPGAPQQVAVRPVKPASPPMESADPGVPATVAVGALLGLALGALGALVLHASDTTVRDPRKLRELTGVPNLGTVAQHTEYIERPLTDADPLPSERAEDFKRLRTNLQFLDVDRPRRVVLVTSPLQGEGKSTTVANLAVAMASSGRRVIIVDADLRRPRLAELFGVETQVGLTTVLSNAVDLDQAVQSPSGTGIDVLTAGSTPPNPSELLGSQHMRHVLGELAAHYDAVLVDSPPLLPVTDAAVLAPAVDAVVLVCRYQKTTTANVQMARDGLASVSASLAGTVVTMVPRTSKEVYGTARPYVAATATPQTGRGTPSATPRTREVSPRPRPEDETAPQVVPTSRGRAAHDVGRSGTGHRAR